MIPGGKIGVDEEKVPETSSQFFDVIGVEASVGLSAKLKTRMTRR